MRDAFGGTFMLNLILIFIVMYVTFATIAVSYAKTFRLKNKVIDIVEQGQLDYTSITNNKSTEAIDGFLRSSSYNLGGNTSAKANCGDGIFTDAGACILPISYEVNGNYRYYYRITLYMAISIPGIHYGAVFPISGETEDFSRNYRIDESKIENSKERIKENDARKVGK